MTVSAAICSALLCVGPYDKVKQTRELVRNWRKGRLAWRFDVPMPDSPGRPAVPVLLPPSQMPRRGRARSVTGRVAMLHALAHIEFVAIDLALDMAGRFGDQMDRSFVNDFLTVASEEAMHFALLDRHLRSLGSYYGALPAHGGLWETAEATSGDVAARLAVVPMVLEARGLDVTPMTITRFREAGDLRAETILTRILADEIKHVATGVKHFKSVAQRIGKNPDELWKSLVKTYFRGNLRGPFNDSARHAAGLSLNFYRPLAS